jgi:hypothetical protein
MHLHEHLLTEDSQTKECVHYGNTFPREMYTTGDDSLSENKWKSLWKYKILKVTQQVEIFCYKLLGYQ